MALDKKLNAVIIKLVLRGSVSAAHFALSIIYERGLNNGLNTYQFRFSERNVI